MLLSDLFENDKQLAEKWSAKYKRSINCSNPKGFSQRAHCQSKKKRVSEDATSELASELKNTKATSYDAIDKLMKKIAKDYNITANELHDLWVKKYNETPDDWIKDKLSEAKVTLYTDPSYFGADVSDNAGEGLSIQEIPLDKLVGFEPDEKMQDTKSAANMSKMVDLLKAGKGKELPPILVRKYKDGYQVLDGHHRFHAYKKAGLKTIPSKIVPDEDIKVVDKKPVNEGPIWDKVKKTAAAGAVAGAAGYGALTGQFTDKAKEPARAPIEINIPGGDLEQQKPAVKKEKEKLTPSTATNANPEMEKLVFVTALRSGVKGKELAQFMAQVAHETLGFQRLVEVGDKEYFNRYDPKHSPEKAKILGNVKPGDGLRYKGRGFIQITGRDNYRRAGKALGIDLENNPKLASDPKVAAKIAVWYWKSRVKPAVDDYTDTIGVTSKINPSMNGLGDRDMNFRHYLQRLQLED